MSKKGKFKFKNVKITAPKSVQNSVNNTVNKVEQQSKKIIGGMDKRLNDQTDNTNFSQKQIDLANKYQQDLIKNAPATNNVGPNRTPEHVNMELLKTLADIIYHTGYWNNYSEAKKKILKSASDNNIDLNKNIAIFNDPNNNNLLHGKSNHNTPYSLAETLYQTMLSKVHTMNVTNIDDANKIINFCNQLKNYGISIKGAKSLYNTDWYGENAFADTSLWQKSSKYGYQLNKYDFVESHKLYNQIFVYSQQNNNHNIVYTDYNQHNYNKNKKHPISVIKTFSSFY